MDDSRSRKLVHKHSFAYLLVVPVLLAVATAVVLFVHSDLNMAMLYSQCHSRSRLNGLSRLPIIGAPSCFIVSFFHEALKSVRSLASVSVVLSFIAGLLTVSTVESARICNWPNLLIAYPTGAWLVFNLIGGALVWELVIIPSFFHQSKAVLRMREGARNSQEQVEVEIRAQDPNLGSARRHLKVVAEVFAIPISVAIGFVTPSIAMLITNSPIAIGV
ncbi:hypothetical protein MKZ38_010144 [Zalerion maritima]|uniref:Uncharacterized protein n=1 Tax=Zalerion maritima TaxID=339359 RepID=A0AAD5RG22_9PEZI|nr:hypothetical protein MKZ38_010144 [Zalerion maritima]